MGDGKMSDADGRQPERLQRRSLRDAQRDLTRTRILEAAEACFAAKGMSATGFDEIAVRAGVSRATLYLHFSNKSAILLQLLALRLGEVRRLYARLCDLEVVDEAGALNWLSRYAGSIRRHRDALPLFGVGMADDADVSSVIEEHRRGAIALLGERFAAFALNDERPDRPVRSARALLMIFQIDQVAAFAAVSGEDDAEARAALAITASALAVMLTQI